MRSYCIIAERRHHGDGFILLESEGVELFLRRVLLRNGDAGEQECADQ